MGIMMSLTGLGDGVEKSLNLDAKMDLLLLNMEETANVSTQKLIKRRLLRVMIVDIILIIPIGQKHYLLLKQQKTFILMIMLLKMLQKQLVRKYLTIQNRLNY